MPLADYATTPTQKKVAELLDEGLSPTGIASQIGRDPGAVRRDARIIKARASQKEIPQHSSQIPDGYKIKGTSTLYKDGEPALQWVKTSEDRERMADMMRESIEAMCQDLPKLEASDGPDDCQVDDELMAVYPLGDPHIGVLSWGEETGQDWDLEIAERSFTGVFDRLVKTAPRCREAVIINLGDYFHADNMEGVTTRSGHTLDMDGRYAKMVRIGVKIMRRMIDSALEHHAHVRVINAVGNHDDTASLFLAVALSNLYEDDKRVTVDSAPTPFHYVEWGSCLFGVHHGHSCKIPALPGVMASDQAEAWGRTLYRYWYTGHIHHDSKKEFPGVTVESFRTLAAKDAYATWGGYRAGQDSKCIVLHKRHGEVERHTVNLSMI